MHGSDYHFCCAMIALQMAAALVLHGRLFFIPLTCLLAFFLPSSSHDLPLQAQAPILSMHESLAAFPHWANEDPGWSPPTFNVLDFGALGNGLDDDTQAFLDTWAAACSVPLATIYVPYAYIFVVGALIFWGPCAPGINMQVDGTIFAIGDPDAWDPNVTAWLKFEAVVGFKLTGSGVIDGNGQQWWDQSCKVNFEVDCRGSAPTSVVFKKCVGIEISSLILKDSQQFHLSIEDCIAVEVSGLQVTAPESSPNTDGIHVVRSQVVNVEGCIIATGDDCISIQTGSSDIHINEITCGPGHGISIGGLGKDGSWACVSNIFVNDVVIIGAKNGLRIKTWQGGTGAVHSISFQNVKMENVGRPIVIDQFYCDSIDLCENQTSAVQIYDVSYVNIEGTSSRNQAIWLACSDALACQNIYLENVKLSLADSDDSPNSFCWNAYGDMFGLVDPTSCLTASNLGPLYDLQAC